MLPGASGSTAFAAASTRPSVLTHSRAVFFVGAKLQDDNSSSAAEKHITELPVLLKAIEGAALGLSA